MNEEQILDKTVNHVKKEMTGEKQADASERREASIQKGVIATGHDWWHVYRVWKMALHIAQEENDSEINMLVVQLGALLHDIADWKFHDEDAGPRAAREWLQSMSVDENIIAHVCDIIQNVSFKGAGVESNIRTKEGMIVQDADRLDALGAIGIARCFAYGGYKGNEIYNSEIKAIFHESFDQYKNSKGTSINHFYEKLLLLKNLMNTATARKIAHERHKFIEQFLERFHKEWEGKE